MPDWDKNSPELQHNIALALAEAKRSAKAREKPTLAAAKHWHSIIMQDLDVPDPRRVEAFRGEPGLEFLQVKVRENWGVYSEDVAGELARFETNVQRFVGELDAMIPPGQEPDRDQTAAILDVCAWAHAEWARIHPFANGNGRTARLWANFIARRHGLPSFVRMRPRPDRCYGTANLIAMKSGDWKPTRVIFERLFNDFFNQTWCGVLEGGGAASAFALSA